MKHLRIAERACLGLHIFSMAFGLAGLLLVLPNPEFIAQLSPLGLKAFSWGMSQGGVSYIILGAIAVGLFGYRTLGLKPLLAFFIPSFLLSLSSELLGTSTGFPFGAYHYLSGLGYKIAGLVPFTIPLSWFYMGFVCFLLATALLEVTPLARWQRQIAAISLGAILLTAWDLVLDPAMSQTPYPFWAFEEVGSFFGMPYRNIAGWIGTGVVYMTVATALQNGKQFVLSRRELGLPVAVYLVNFIFGASITLVLLDAQFTVPTLLSSLFGVVPALLCWRLAPEEVVSDEDAPGLSETEMDYPALETAAK
ncbi:carotenoid biosynthesis protein [Phormidium yuhuli AB48]|uniref:Carotenoid biosynthesis protein n=1 Tax=Phormidium yuhuli AB48 TaxID=2940671 RepID=A0ABY5ANG5_9CYAN|nr:carotenoid biosynthesis protein [Phormidium yuhuli]USR90722.1 carotenoid biosynthesis protein [Phormidium yuhuli AB48]